ncbi:hypothetical protein KIW84_033978 [Lathyrus oleraceus]|uniref:Uncharacterized protein n=1 Tax=Pisum sativum TaxID=3888 RepID=A0A9D4Y1I3_PEA|nr:hypothetical protein KIW84_033978 [Pisum sativum]
MEGPPGQVRSVAPSVGNSVLWAYRTTPHSTTGETPFRLTYGTEAVIPVEIRAPTRRTEEPLDEEMNDETLRAELDLVEEIQETRKTRERANWRPTGKALTASATKRATGPITWKTYKENNSLDHGTQKNLDNITAKYTTGRRGRYDHALRPQNPREEPRDPGTIRGHMTNTTLPDGWDLDQDSTSKYQDWQGTQLAMGGPKPRDQGSNNGPGPRYPRAQSPTLRRFPKPRRLTKSSRVRIHTNKYQTQTSTMNDNVNIHALKTIRAAEAKYARRPYYNARRPNT